MNPFDLRGPEFLVFYFFFSAAVIGCITLLRRLDENRESGKPPLDDPYLVAYLRGGEGEAVRVAALSLFDRGLLTFKSSGSSSLFSAGENRLELTDARAIETVKRPIEKRVLSSSLGCSPARTLARSGGFVSKLVSACCLVSRYSKSLSPSAAVARIFSSSSFSPSWRPMSHRASAIPSAPSEARNSLKM